MLPLHDCYQEADHNGDTVPAARSTWRTAVAHYNTVEIAFGDLMEQNLDACCSRAAVRRHAAAIEIGLWQGLICPRLSSPRIR